jgi:NADP-dependent 3-hydroxy acid dehydrogenase YdfG
VTGGSSGTTHMAKRAVDHMVANGNGRILIVSSVSATTPTPYEGVYGGTNAFGGGNQSRWARLLLRQQARQKITRPSQHRGFA